MATDNHNDDDDDDDAGGVYHPMRWQICKTRVQMTMVGGKQQ